VGADGALEAFDGGVHTAKQAGIVEVVERWVEEAAGGLRVGETAAAEDGGSQWTDTEGRSEGSASGGVAVGQGPDGRH